MLPEALQTSQRNVQDLNVPSAQLAHLPPLRQNRQTDFGHHQLPSNLRVQHSSY